ncbi:hypothetical protein AB1Y20_010200 [Prymnesium parvum]|uniref:Glycosyl transferase CAP10 domain-containing protein n=1 Tax=Prymnesium parvum TaxID=97485 RepID=A0AB34K641_PRYPA
MTRTSSVAPECERPPAAQLLTSERLYRPPPTPSMRRCQAWQSEAEPAGVPPLSSEWRQRLSALAAHWLQPFVHRGISRGALAQRVPEAPPAVEVFNGVAEGRSCMLVLVRGGRVLVEMPQYARTFGQSVYGCNVTDEKGRLTTVLRLLLLTLAPPSGSSSAAALPDFEFRLCGDDFCHGLWEQRAAPFFTMVSCGASRTIPAVQWNTLEERDPDLSVWARTLTQRRQHREQQERRWSCRQSLAVWRGSLNDMYTYNLYWSANRTLGRRKIDASNWREAGRAALAFQRCNASQHLVDVRFKLLRSRLHFQEAKECVRAASTDKPNRMSMPEQISRFKYMAHVEGNGGWADRLRHAILSGSLVIKQDMGVQEWYEPLLEPWKHYIPVSSTLHNLSQAVRWAQQHDERALKMTRDAAVVLENVLSESALLHYQSELFRMYASLWKGGGSSQEPPARGFARAEFKCALVFNVTADRPGYTSSGYTARDCFFVDEVSGYQASSLDKIAAKQAQLH